MQQVAQQIKDAVPEIHKATGWMWKFGKECQQKDADWISPETPSVELVEQLQRATANRVRELEATIEQIDRLAVQAHRQAQTAAKSRFKEQVVACRTRVVEDDRKEDRDARIQATVAKRARAVKRARRDHSDIDLEEELDLT